MFINQQSEFEKIIPNIMSKPSWGVDFETDGPDPRTNRHIMMQLGREDEVYCVDTRTVNIEPLRAFFESRKHLKVGQAFKFDYKMLRGTSNIKCEHIRDLFITEHLIDGRLGPYLNQSKSLDNIIFKRLGIVLPNKKLMQQSFVGHTGDFSEDQKKYAGDDVQYLINAYKKQLEDVKRLGLENTVVLECECIPAFGDMEFDGIVLDRDKWNDVLQENLRLQKEIETEINEMIAPFIDQSWLDKGESFNLGSPKQVLKLLQKMSMKVDGQLITSTNDKVLSRLVKYPIIRKIQDYRSYGVLVSTFGQPYINAVNLKTGCIHPDFFQIGAANGRPTSGKSEVNPLNIPRDNRFRSCVVGMPGEVVETDDYNACESRILASQSGDPKMIDMFNSGKDYHCETAYEIIGKRIHKSDPWREIAKQTNHSMAYGGGAGLLYERIVGQGLKFTFEEARDVISKSRHTFATAYRFITDAGNFAAKNGWIANANGRIRKFKMPEQDEMYEKRIAAIKREAGNFVISSVNADILKQAMINIRASGYNTKFVNAIYDELVTRTPSDVSPEFVVAKRLLMQRAAEKFITKVPVVINGNIGKCWYK